MSLARAIELAGFIPSDRAPRELKKAYSELLSRELAFELAALLRASPIFHAVSPRRPAEVPPGDPPTQRLKKLKEESPEKYFLGGFGRKKLDVSLADEQDGLLFALSVKTITSRDTRTKNFNKNFKNRFGDLCAEATSVHMRSPYTYMAGIFAMPTGAAFDGTSKRKSTASRAIRYLKSISSRSSHEQSPEKFEKMTFLLFDPRSEEASPNCVWDFAFEGVASARTAEPYRLFDVATSRELTVDDYLQHLEQGFLERNPFLDE